MTSGRSQLLPFGGDFSPVINLQFPSAAQINSGVDVGTQLIPEEQSERNRKTNGLI